MLKYRMQQNYVKRAKQQIAFSHNNLQYSTESTTERQGKRWQTNHYTRAQPVCVFSHSGGRGWAGSVWRWVRARARATINRPATAAVVSSLVCIAYAHLLNMRSLALLCSGSLQQYTMQGSTLNLTLNAIGALSGRAAREPKSPN